MFEEGLSGSVSCFNFSCWDGIVLLMYGGAMH